MNSKRDDDLEGLEVFYPGQDWWTEDRVTTQLRKVERKGFTPMTEEEANALVAQGLSKYKDRK